MYIALIIQIRYDIADMNLFRSALNACIIDGLAYTKLFLYSNETSLQSNLFTSSKPVSNNEFLPIGTRTTSSLIVSLPPVTLTSLNQSLRNFSHSRT